MMKMTRLDWGMVRSRLWREREFSSPSAISCNDFERVNLMLLSTNEIDLGYRDIPFVFFAPWEI